MTAKEIARETLRACREQAKAGRDSIPHLSGSARMRTEIQKHFKRFLDDAELDRDLGVLSEAEYRIEAKALEIFGNAMEHYEVW